MKTLVFKHEQIRFYISSEDWTSVCWRMKQSTILWLLTGS